MKKIFPKVVAILLILSLYWPETLAQEESRGQLWFCWEATVKQFWIIKIHFQTF